MITQAQEDAIDKIEDIMREHFTAGIFAVTVEGESNNDKDTIRFGYHGGFSAAIGLCVLGQSHLTEKKSDGW